MKLRIFLLALLALSLGANAQNQIDKQGRKQGHWIRTDNNGAKIFEGDFKDGQETGTFTYYYPNGNVRIKNVYTVPGKVCNHEAYDEQGHLLAKGVYNQKNRDGEWHIFDEQGRQVKLATYKMGIKQGPTVIFTSTGDTAEYTTWRDNRRDGRWWKRIGTKGYITGTFRNGGLEGKLVEYDDNGLLCREGYYKNGDKEGSYRYFENNVLTIDETWKAGSLQDRKVLISTPERLYVSIFSIAYVYPKGKNSLSANVYMMDGKMYKCTETVADIHARIGMDIFQLVDKKNNVIANTACLQGLTKDAEGRQVLWLEPNLPFSIFPDEDCIKMIKSIQREDVMDE